SLVGGDWTFTRQCLRSLDDRRNYCAADEIAPVKRLFASTAQGYFKKLVFITACKLPVDKPFDQAFDRGTDSISFFREHTIVRQVVGEINTVNFSRALLIRTIDFNFPIDAARTQNG